MNTWNKNPILRLLFPYLFGILYSINHSATFSRMLAILWIGWLVLFVTSKSKRVIHTFSLQWIIGCLIVLLFFLLGVNQTRQKSQKNHSNYYGYFKDSTNTLIVKITEAPVVKLKSCRAFAEVKVIKTKNTWRNTRGKLLIFFQGDSCSSKIKYGDLLLLKSTLTLIPSAKNPGCFDYRKYLLNKDIQYQALVDKNNWITTGKNEGNLLVHYSYLLRDYLLSKMLLHGISKDAYAVGAALIYGYEDALNNDLYKSYSASGALHVLSVSGLHVAIVLLILNKFLTFLLKYKRGKILRAVLLLILLWFYALLTGFSPSVLRSAAMFSFIIFGEAANKNASIHNTIAASMLILLLWNPLLLMDVGFQLSYLAVIGIVLWQPIIQVLWSPKNKLLQHVWSIVSVTIVAQLATFPLAFHYFHQFPVYFLWANFIVIPISSLILYLGIIASFLCFNFTLAWPFYFLLNFLLKLLNSSTLFFQKLPLSLLEGISWSVAETFILYGAFLFMGKFYQSRKIIFLKFSLLCFFVTTLLWIQDLCLSRQQKMFIVYAVNKHSAIDLIDGNRNCFFADDSLLANPEKIKQNIRPNWWKLHLKETNIFPNHILLNANRLCNIRTQKNVIEFRNKKILLFNRHSNLESRSELKEKIDWVVLSDNALESINSLCQKFTFKLIIIDASNASYAIKRWTRDCKKLNLPYYQIKENGAFVACLE